MYLMISMLTLLPVKDDNSVLERHLAVIQQQIRHQADHNERILADLQQAQYHLQGNLRDMVNAQSRSLLPLAPIPLGFSFRWRLSRYFCHGVIVAN